MGQPQFMPSSYLTHAVDFDGDGRVDIWDIAAGRVRIDGQLPARTPAGSAGERWGREVRSRKAVHGDDRPRRADAHGRAAAPMREMTVARPLGRVDASSACTLADGGDAADGRR